MYDRKFLSRGFFRSTNGESYSGISLLGNFSKNKPQLGIFYINSGLKFTPHQVIAINFIRELLQFLNKKTGSFRILNILFSFNDNDIYIDITNKNINYKFLLNREEVFIFKLYIIYVINYIDNYENIVNLNGINIQYDNIIRNKLKELGVMTLSKYNSMVYKDNLIKDTNGTIKRIELPTIEHEVHGQKNGKKTGYYLKFFPEYIINIRNTDNNKVKYNGEKYPIQLIVQESNSSESIIFTEVELYKILKFLEQVNNGLIDSNLEYTRLHSKYFMKTTNKYNGNTFENIDYISSEQYFELHELLEKGDLSKIYITLKSENYKYKLVKNKFINIEVLKTLEVGKYDYLNLSISHSGKDGVNDRSCIFQIGNKLGTKELILNVIKGDINNLGKQYQSVSLSETDLNSIIYKIKLFFEILNNPLNQELIKLYKNIETIRLLNIKNEKISKKQIINLLEYTESTKFRINKSLIGVKSEFTISLFIPNVIKQLNYSIFSLKKQFLNINEERYPISIRVSQNSIKVLYFTLFISDVTILYNNLKIKNEFCLIAKNKNYKKILIKVIGDNVGIFYYESNTNNFLNNNLVFSDSYEYSSFMNNLTVIMDEIISPLKSKLVKSIIYINNKLVFK